MLRGPPALTCSVAGGLLGLEPEISSLSGTFAGCVQAARALGDQVIGDMPLTVVVRSVPGLSARYGTRVARPMRRVAQSNLGVRIHLDVGVATAEGDRVFGQLDQRAPRHPGPVLPLTSWDVAVTDELRGRRGDIQRD